MAGISIGHVVHTDRPLTWRSPPCCPRCTLPFTVITPDGPLQRVAYLLDCQHLLCGPCVQEYTLERCITCEICKHRMDIPEDRENATQTLHPSLFVLGLMQQSEYEMTNLEAYWQSDENGPPGNDYPRRSTTEKLPHSDVVNPKKLLELLGRAYHSYAKSKKQLEKQAKIQQENVGSVVEQINAHFIALHNALQIEENQLLQKTRNAYIERRQKNTKDQRQLQLAKDRLEDYIRQGRLFAQVSEKQTRSDGGASWKRFREEVKKFVENEPMKLDGDGRKMLRPPIHYQPRKALLKDVQLCHSLHISALKDDASLVPITHTEADRYSRSMRNEERQPRERFNESFSVKHKREESVRERSKEHSRSKCTEERKAGDEADEPTKSRPSTTSTRKKDHKRSDESTEQWQTGVNSRSVLKSSKSRCFDGSSDSRQSKPILSPWERALARMRMRLKEGANSSELSVTCDSVASTATSKRHNSSQSSSRQNWEAGGGKWRTVNVLHFVSPREFYVQNEVFGQDAALFMMELCNKEAVAHEAVLIAGNAPFTVKPGSRYLVRAECLGNQALNNCWYRAEVQAVDDPNRGEYRVQYIDYGKYGTVKREQIRPLSAYASAMAPNVTRCAVYRLQQPPGANRWTNDCEQLMNGFIGGRPMRMCVMGTLGDGTLLVDLFLPPAVVPGTAPGKDGPGQPWDGYYAPMSLRAALLHLMLAEDASEIYPRNGDARKRILNKHIWQQQRWLKDATAWSLRHASIPPAPILQEHDHFDCTITYAASIEHFYIMPSNWKTTMLEPLQRQLDIVCQTAPYVYCPYVGLVCAFSSSSSSDTENLVDWRRGRVERVFRGRCQLLALDTGELCEASWTHMRLLAPDDPARDRHPLAVRCSLGHIRPRRGDPGARWSQAAINEFLQIVSCGTMRYTVSIGKLEPVPEDNYSVVLYLVNQNEHETCVNGLLVRNGHAECFGLEEDVQDRIRELTPEEIAAQQEPSGPKPTTSTAVVRLPNPREPVVMLRVVSPEEFYVQMCDQQSANEQIHKFLQKHMHGFTGEVDEDAEEEEEEEAGDGTLQKKVGKRKAPGDICVVYARVDESASCQWYRARIETVLDDGVYYEAFLIDRGITTKVHQTNVARLAKSVAHIQPLAFRCRLACLSPVGGRTDWHLTSLDTFRGLIANYTRHAISLDAKPKPDDSNQAIPVVLWGVRLEDGEALAPHRTVHCNLNQALTQGGLAQMTGRFRLFATCGNEAAEEQRLLEEAIEAQLRAETEQLFRTYDAVTARNMQAGGESGAGEGGGSGTGKGGGSGAGDGGGSGAGDGGGSGAGEGGAAAVQDDCQTAENVLNEQELESMDGECRRALALVGSAEGRKPVHAWLPAAPLDKSIFVCMPTYVGSDGTVYLHDVVHEPLLERIRFVIQKHVASNPDRTGTPFVVGRACLARFHLDGNFYRATVKRKLADGRYRVRFVDYGNVEECTGADLLPAAVCGAVPVQAAQVRLSGIIPKEKQGCMGKRAKKHMREWPEAALDACHSLIVQKRCTIRMEPGIESRPPVNSKSGPPVPYCKLQLLEVIHGGKVDVVDVLFDLGLFENRCAGATSQPHSYMNESQPDVPRREMLDDLPNISSVRSSVLPNMSAADRDLKEWINSIDSQLKAKNAANSKTYEDPNEWNFDESCDLLNQPSFIDALEPTELDWNGQLTGTSGTSESGFRLVTVEIDRSRSIPSPTSLMSEEFETSSRISGSVDDGGWLAELEVLEDGRIVSPLFRSFPVLPQPNRSSRGFFAEFTNYAPKQTFYVYPHLEGHTCRMRTMAEKVQQRANSVNELHRWQATLVEPGAPCLAPYKEDGLYYRAIVESRDEQRREVNVLYVDYLNRETVPLAELRKCPIELQRVALRNIPVRLVGVQTNPHLREFDVAQRLSELLQKPFFVKLVEQQDPARRGNASVLPVELYTDADCRTLVYQQMIDSKYFVRPHAPEDM